MNSSYWTIRSISCYSPRLNFSNRYGPLNIVLMRNFLISATTTKNEISHLTLGEAASNIPRTLTVSLMFTLLGLSVDKSRTFFKPKCKMKIITLKEISYIFKKKISYIPVWMLIKRKTKKNHTPHILWNDCRFSLPSKLSNPSTK